MYIGIDLGGTNIAVGLVNENKEIIAKKSTPTLKERDYKEIVKDMAELSKKVVKEFDYNKDDPKTEIRIAKLFNDAGIIGAAMATLMK